MTSEESFSRLATKPGFSAEEVERVQIAAKDEASAMCYATIILTGQRRVPHPVFDAVRYWACGYALKSDKPYPALEPIIFHDPIVGKHYVKKFLDVEGQILVNGIPKYRTVDDA